MKVIKYQTLNQYNVGTEESPDWKEGFGESILGYNEANLKLAEQEAYDGVYIIEDVEETSEPSKLDRLESQIAYLAMMTGFMEVLEV